jgi:hypothetical protein
MNKRKLDAESDPVVITPAMQRYIRLINQGYSIQARLAPDRSGYLDWRPFLVDPHGKTVKRVSLPMAVKLQEAGYIAKPKEDE